MKIAIYEGTTPRVVEVGWECPQSTASAEQHEYVWNGLVENGEEAEWTELFLGGIADKRVIVPISSAFGFTLRCTAFDGTVAKRWTAVGLILCDELGEVALVGLPTVTVIAESDGVGGTQDWDMRIVADVQNQALTVEVLGEASTDIGYTIRGEIEKVREIVPV